MPMRLAKLTNTLTFLAATVLVSAPVAADTENPRARLGPAVRDLDVGPNMNAAGRDLRGSEFVGQDLSGAVFDDCNLGDVRIYQCDLPRASFRGADLARLQIGDCNVDGADFTDALINGAGHLAGGAFYKYVLEISPEQLKSTRSYKTKDLRQCMIHGAWGAPSFDFRGAHLERAVLTSGDFTNCDMSDAHVYGVTFRNFTLTFEQLASTADYRRGRLCISVQGGGTSAAGLTGRWDFSGIDMRGSTLVGMRSEADFTDARINCCSMRWGFTSVQLASTASYKNGDLTDVQMVFIDLSGCDLTGVNLTGSSFAQCQFAGVRLDDAVVTDVNFVSVSGIPPGCKGLTMDQVRSTWNYKHGRMEGIRLPDKLAEALKREESANASE